MDKRDEMITKLTLANAMLESEVNYCKAKLQECEEQLAKMSQIIMLMRNKNKGGK